MQEMPQNQAPTEKTKPSLVTVLLLALILALAATTFWFVLRVPESKISRTTEANLSAKMSAEEQAYAGKIQIENIALSRAENFIHQEVTILEADAVNGGEKAVQRLWVRVEFSDDLHQIILRESRGVLGAAASALGPGQRRSFQISFDRVPASWNGQQPTVQVSYLQLSSGK